MSEGLGFPKLGISLRYLIDVFAENIVDDTKTSAVSKDVRNRKLGKSFVNHLLEEGATKHIGDATVYVIHSHTYKFKEELLSCLENFLSKKEEQDVYVWIDFLSLNLGTLQRQLRSYNWWEKEFVDDLNKNFNQIVIAWAKWPMADVMKRSWCVWEIYMALVAQVPISIAITENEQQKLRENIVDNFKQLVLCLKDLDIVNTLCSDRRMKKKILASVKKHENDFESFNFTAILAVKEWWTLEALEMSKEMDFSNLNAETFKSTLGFLNSLSYLSKQTGDSQKTITICEEILEVLSDNEQFCKEYPLVAAREYNNLSVVFSENEKVLEAIEFGEKSIGLLKDYVIYHMEKTPENTFDGLITERKFIATSLNNQANLFISLEQNAFAIERYLESIQIKTEIYGPDHILVAAGLNNLGLAYASSKDFQSAERVYRQALQTRVRVLGVDAVEVAQTRHNLAEVLFLAGHANEGKKEAKKAYDIVRKQFGKENEISAAFKDLVDEIDASINQQNTNS